MALTQLPVYRKNVSEGIIRHLIRQSKVGVEYEEGESEEVVTVADGEGEVQDEAIANEESDDDDG